jgi:hypothetical protein
LQRLEADSFEIYTRLLVVTLARGGYPHEIIVCMFNKLFERPERLPGGGRAKRWPPARIVREKSTRALWRLAEELESDYAEAAALPPQIVTAVFQLLHRQMVCRLEQIIKPKDQTAKTRWVDIRQRFVGQTRLCDYYGRTPEADIANWSYKVFRNVRQAMLGENWGRRPLEALLKEVAAPLGC